MALADLIRDAATRYGVDPDFLVQEAQIESRLDPNAASKSGAKGLFQFMDPTRAQYGGFNPFDPAASADAGARLARDNAMALSKSLGRDPTPGELYLAHQQGAGGASKLLLNPDVPAASLVGLKAVVQNGGHQAMTARDFANLWTSRFGGASPALSSMQNVAGGMPASAPRAAGPLNMGALGQMFASDTPPPTAKPAQPSTPAPRKPNLAGIYSVLSPNLVLS